MKYKSRIQRTQLKKKKKITSNIISQGNVYTLAFREENGDQKHSDDVLKHIPHKVSLKIFMKE